MKEIVQHGSDSFTLSTRQGHLQHIPGTLASINIRCQRISNITACLFLNQPVGVPSETGIEEVMVA